MKSAAPARLASRRVTAGSSAGVKGRELRSGQAHLVTDLFVSGDGQAGRAGGARVNRSELLGSGQAHLVTNLPVASDSGEGFDGGLGGDGGENPDLTLTGNRA